VAPTTIYMIEAGRSVPHLSVVRKIVDVLQVEARAISEFRHAITVYGAGR
jgi:DNA-binding XRE family transcriptional regulator